MLSPKKLIQNARNRIAKWENHNTEGYLAAKPSPDNTYIKWQPLTTTSPEATCWCALGSLGFEAGIDTDSTGTMIKELRQFEEGKVALDALVKAAIQVYRESGYESRAQWYESIMNDPYVAAGAVYTVNDNLGHEATLRMFDLAEAALRGE